ncbi:MAG: PAS domain S-box protein [Herpetosiphonaceae bacterium]|nr:PAS domain S-box protein [Herpetosiphonaceae bacterium]
MQALNQGKTRRIVELARVIFITAWLAGVGAVLLINHRSTATWVELLAYSFVIPILLAAFAYGRAGGLLVALIASLITGWLAFGQPEVLQSTVAQRLLAQIVFFNLSALVTSWLSEREKEAARSYRRLFEGVQVGLYRTSPEGNFLDTNPALIAMLHFPSREALLRVNLDDLYVDPALRETARQQINACGEIHDFDHLLRCYDGAEIWVRSSARKICTPEGLVACYDGSLVDITERRQAEAALRESDRKLRLITENSNDLILAYDLNEHLMYVNPAIEKLVGYTVEELHDKQFINWIHPDDEQRMLGYWRQVLSGRGYSGEIFRRITRSGEVRWTLGSWGPLYDENGRQIGVQGSERDITERKQAEDALQKLNEELEKRVIERTAELETAYHALERELLERLRAEESLHRIAETTQITSDILRSLNAAPNVTKAFPAIASGLKAITDCAWVSLALLDTEGTMLEIAAHSQFHAPVNLGNRLPIGHLAGSHDVLAGNIHLTADLETELDFPVEFALYQAGYRAQINLPLRHHDRIIGAVNVAWMEPAGYNLAHLPLLSQINEAIGLAIARSRAFDETQRRAREAETLREAGAIVAATLSTEEAMVRILQQLAHVVAHDGASVQLLRDGYLEIVAKHSPGNEPVRLGERFEVPGDNLNTLVITQRQPLRSGNVKFRQHHGNIHSWIGVPLIVGDRVMGMLTVDSQQEDFFTADDTRLVSAFADQVVIALENARLFAAAQDRAVALEVSNRELESFSYSVSHDLRTPLRHIASFASLLHDHLSADLDQTGQHYLEVISDAASRMNRLIDDLLAFSRLGRTDIHHVPVDLLKLIREAQQELGHAMTDREIEWQIGDLPEVQGDPDLLRLVLVNLLSNALKYSRSRQPARITLGRQESSADEVICFVRDNGVGFDMQYVDKLFGVFQRLHNDKQFEGSGIGLANIQRIIQRHGGRVWAEGVPDGGATFYFSLPQR